MSGTWALVALAVLFGLLIGSFLNACIYRLPRHASVVRPRSFCPKCGKQLSWFDNIPVGSYVLLLGRCRYCRNAIALRYPLTEVVTAIVFAAVAFRWGADVEALKWAIFGALMIALFWTDLETRLLPDALTLTGTAAGLVLSVLVPLHSFWLQPFMGGLPDPVARLLTSVASALLLAGPFFVFAEIYARIRHIAPVGLGDIKLLCMLGSFLGLELGLLTLIIGSAGGAIIGLGYIWGTGKDPKTEPIPYGSFLCAAGLLVEFAGAELFNKWTVSA